MSLRIMKHAFRKSKLQEGDKVKGKTVLLAALCWFMLLFAGQARAIVLDFGDNVACPPGFYGLAYGTYYNAKDYKDDDGDTVRVGPLGNKHLDLSLWQLALRPLWYGKLGNFLVAANVIIPFGRLEARNPTTGRTQTSSGLGDISFSPAIFLFTDEKSGTAISYWPFASAPTGPFKKSRLRDGGATNYGLGYWYIQHQLAFYTNFCEKSPWTYDMNINYYQKLNGNRQDPGDSMEVEGILGYGITPTIRVGAFATYYWDLNKSEIYGAEVDKKRAFSAGPSIAYGTEKWGLNFRWVRDFTAENTTKGDYLFLRASYAF